MELGWVLVLLIPFSVIAAWIVDEMYQEYVLHHYY
jgi:hypothetical protein